MKIDRVPTDSNAPGSRFAAMVVAVSWGGGARHRSFSGLCQCELDPHRLYSPADFDRSHEKCIEKYSRTTTSETSCAIVPEMASSSSHFCGNKSSRSTVVDGGEFVVVQRGESSRRIPARWLRLAGRWSPSDIDPSTGHRLFDSDVPAFRIQGAFRDLRRGHRPLG